MAKQSGVAIKFLVDEQEFVKHKNYFLEIARKKYPGGFTILKDVQKVPLADGVTGYQVEFSDAMLILLEYLGSQYSNQESQLRQEVLDRVIQHLITHGYN